MTKIKQRSCRCCLTKKVRYLLAVCVLLSVTAFAGTVFAADAEEYLTYTLNTTNNTATVTGCKADIITTEQLKNLVIPDTLTVNGTEYTVVEVGGFINNQSIVTVTLPDTLEALTVEAFRNCDALTTVTMPSCKTIGKRAFYNCKYLSKINSDYTGEILLPDNLEGIKYEAFRTSNHVKTIVIPEGVEQISGFLCYKSTSVKNIIFLSGMEDFVDGGLSSFKTMVGGTDNFTTVNLFARASSPIALYSQTDDARDNYGKTDAADACKLFNLITEESDIIVYDESFTDGNATAVTALADAVGFKARVLNTGDTAQKLTAIISVTGKNNILKGVNFYEMTIPAQSGKTLTDANLAIENISFEAGDEISVMFWEDLTQIKPIVTRKITHKLGDVLVMAIGNSFAVDSVTYLDDIAAADGVKLSAYNLYIDGQTLGGHYAALNDAAEYDVQLNGVTTGTKLSIKDAAKKCNWDYVMLQGATHNSVYDDAFWGKDDETGEAVDAAPIWTAFKDEMAAAAPGAKRLVHAVWAGYEDAASEFNGGEFANGIPDARGAMTAKILERAQLGADIYSTEAASNSENAYIPTAVAVDYLIRHYDFPEYEKDADGNYLNGTDTRAVYRDGSGNLTDNVGRVLAGLVWYEMITGTPATETKYTSSTLAEQDMEWIKEAAHYACENYMTYDPSRITLNPAVDRSGLTFAADKIYQTYEPLAAMPYTFEATVRIAEGDTSRQGAIFGSYKNGSNTAVILEVYSNGYPRLYLIDDNLVKHDYMFKGANVCTGDWAHLAITCDTEKEKLYCYVNGELADSLNMHETHPVSIDMALPARLGGDSRSGNSQYFKGRIKNVSLYSDTRSASEIKSDAAGTTPDKDNLIAAYDLSVYTIEDTPDTVEDISGNEIHLDYLGDDWIKHVPLPDDYAYSFALVGDTQRINYRYPEKYAAYYDWIVENAEKQKMKWVFGLGDITEGISVDEWQRAKDNITKLDGVVPYSLIRGNHDSTAKLNEYFAGSAFDNNILGCWTKNTRLQNTYQTFSIGGRDYLVLCLNYAPGDPILTWADGVIAKYPNHNVILSTHAYLDKDGSFLNESSVTSGIAPSVLLENESANNGDDVWDKFVKKHKNIVLVLCGHVPSDKVVVAQKEGDNGNIVTQIKVDPSNEEVEYEGAGMIAMLYFSEDGKKADVRYYSIMRDTFFKADNQFSIEVDVVEAAAE